MGVQLPHKQYLHSPILGDNKYCCPDNIELRLFLFSHNHQVHKAQRLQVVVVQPHSQIPIAYKKLMRNNNS